MADTGTILSPMDRNYDRRARQPERREWGDRHRNDRRNDRRGQNFRPGKRQHESEYPARKRFTADTLTLVERKAQLVENSLWDIEAPGYKNVEADVLKLVLPGLQAGDAPPSEPSAVVIRIRDVKPLTPENSAALRTVHVEGPEFESYLHKLFPGKQFTKLSDGEWLLPSPQHVAVLLALPGTYDVKRPAGLVLPGSTTDIFCNPEARVVVDGQPIDNPVVVEVDNHKLQFILEGDGKRLFEHPFHIQNSFNINERGPSERSPMALQIINAIPPRAQTDPSVVETVRSKCSEFGEIRNITTKNDSTLFYPRVIVEFASADACSKAIDALGGCLIGGRRVLVAPAR